MILQDCPVHFPLSVSVPSGSPLAASRLASGLYWDLDKPGSKLELSGIDSATARCIDFRIRPPEARQSKAHLMPRHLSSLTQVQPTSF